MKSLIGNVAVIDKFVTLALMMYDLVFVLVIILHFIYSTVFST